MTRFWSRHRTILPILSILNKKGRPVSIRDVLIPLFRKELSPEVEEMKFFTVSPTRHRRTTLDLEQEPGFLPR